MASKSTVAAQAILNLYRGIDVLGFQGDLALYYDDPRLGGLEVAGGSYVRQPITFGAPSGFVMTNSLTVTFATPTTDWGLANFAAVMNGSDVWDVQAIDAPEINRTIIAGSTPITFAPGSILLRLQ